MSETAQSESRSEDSAAGKTDGEIKAIAAETEIAAIEEGGKQGTGEVGNPADRRLPLIVRIYGIVMLIEGVVTLPFIVLACLYSIRAVFSGKVAFDALSLTAILSVVHAAVLLVATACLAVFGVMLIMNKRRHIAQWTYLMIPLTLAEGLLSLALQGLGVNLIGPAIQLVVLIALHVTADPSLREERRLQFALRRMDARSAYEDAASQGMAGRDLTGKGYISLDFFNLFWLFAIGCVFGLVIETIYHFILFGEYQDRAGFLWGPFSPIYGFGVVIVTVLLNHLWQSNWLLIFCSSAVIGGAFEYFTSWFMEKLFHMRWWDYSRKKIQLNGRICLQNSLLFGLACVLLCHVVNPPVMAWLFHIGSAYTIPVASFLFGLYLMDNVLSVRSAIQLSHRLDDLQKVRQEIRSHLEEKAAQLQQKYEGRLEEVTDRFMAGLEDANDDFLKEKKLYLAQLRSGEDLFERRLLRSHPDLRSKRHSRKLLNLLREKRPGQKDKK